MVHRNAQVHDTHLTYSYDNVADLNLQKILVEIFLDSNQRKDKITARSLWSDGLPMNYIPGSVARASPEPSSMT